MASLISAPARARQVRGQKAAARLYNDLEYELALGDHDPDQQVDGEQALKVLEDRFPGIKTAARRIETPPSLSHNASRRLAGHEGRSRRASRTAIRPAGGTNKTAASRPRTVKINPNAPLPAPVQRTANTAANAITSAGDTGWGSLILEIALGGVLLSLGFLLLTHAQAPTDLAQGTSRLLEVVVSPTIDPLNPKGA